MTALLVAAALLGMHEDPGDLAVLYRFFDTRESEHFYSYSPDELKSLRADKERYTGEKPIGLVPLEDRDGTVRLWRANRRGKYLFYTQGRADVLRKAVVEPFDVRVFRRKREGMIPIHASYLPEGQDAFFDPDLDTVKKYANDSRISTNKIRSSIKNAFYVFPLPPE